MKKNILSNSLVAATLVTSMLSVTFPKIALSSTELIRVCKKDNTSDSKALVSVNHDGNIITVEGDPRAIAIAGNALVVFTDTYIGQRTPGQHCQAANHKPLQRCCSENIEIPEIVIKPCHVLMPRLFPSPMRLPSLQHCSDPGFCPL